MSALSRLRPRRTRLHQRGLSLVEMMVGVAVGLFIVAASALLVSAQISDNHRLLLETQVQQDLRAATDIITRELRRAGHWGAAQQAVWNPGAGFTVPNPYLSVTPASGSADNVSYTYKRPDDAAGTFGFKLEDSVIKTLLPGGAGWQELTDHNVLNVLSFTVAADTPAQVRLMCPKACPLPAPGADPDYCWPTVAVRTLTVTLTGQAVSDSAITRTVTSKVRLRNDAVTFNSTGAGGTSQACPS